MYSKPSIIISKAFYLLLILLGTYLGLKFLLPWTAPMLLAFAAAVLIEPLVSLICRAWRFPRSAAAGLCVLGFLAVCGGVLWFLGSRLVQELRSLSGELPALLSAVSDNITVWTDRLEGLIKNVPESVSAVLDSAVEGAADYLAGLPAVLSARAVEAATAFVSKLPTVLLFAVTAVMGLYFISAAYPKMVGFLRRQVPEKIFERVRRVKRDLQRSIGKYFKAQLIMMGITFAELLAAFSFMRIDFSLVLALGTAVIDALPVFGAGTVLLPWAAYELLAGDPARGAALAVTYGMVTILRSCIQAKLLGDQLGLHPIATLLAIYAGWKAMGIWGMIIFPIGAISLKRMNDSGVIHLWNTEDKNGRNNFQHSGGNGHERSGRNEYPSG